jgi:hypothetical protein
LQKSNSGCDRKEEIFVTERRRYLLVSRAYKALARQSEWQMEDV